MPRSKYSQNMEDFFSNVPDIVIDQILEKLPIRMAAQTSVLSKQWERGWLSLKHLTFDSDFHKQQKNIDGSFNWQESSRIISRILLHRSGPVHYFYLYVPDAVDGDLMNLNQWISFLSKNGVQTIRIDNSANDVYITSDVFRCSELAYLELGSLSFNPPPTCFHGFPKLKHLELVNIDFCDHNIFRSLIKKCRMLTTLNLRDWSGMDHVVIDAPSLQTLILKGKFESLAFRNVLSLKSISLVLTSMLEQIVVETIVDAINLLASSCQLQSIKFDGYSCQLLAAGSIMRSPSVTFKHLNELCLINLNFSNFADFRYLLSMIECCPYIKKLDISVLAGENVGPRILDFNYNYKLDHLYEVSIARITGSSAELKFVEYLLAISTVLKNVFFKSLTCDTELLLKMSKTLMGFPRASPNARLLFLEK